MICAREESFQELFPVLGERTAQDAIRAATPDGRHCGLLKSDSEACLRCPLPENPYPGWKVKGAQAAALNSDSIAAAHELYSAFELGLLTREDIFRLSPQEVKAIRIMQEQSELHRGNTAGEFIASKIAEFLAPVFGAKK